MPRLQDEQVSARCAPAPKGRCGVIFDCDGVLIDSRAANISYYNRFLEAVGRPPMTEAEENYVHMASMHQALEHILRPEEIVRYHELAAKIPYRNVVLPLLELEPGLRDLLEWLHGMGVRMAVHTNRGSGMWDVLDKFGLRGLFDPVMTVDDVQPKPSPEGVHRIMEAWNMPPACMMFVGDSSTDALAAAGGGVPFVAYKNAELAAAVHVNNFDALRTVIEAVQAGLPVRDVV